MTLLCPCGSSFEMHSNETLCPKCSRFFERGVEDLAPCWVDWNQQTSLRAANG